MGQPENISVSRKDLEYLITLECERPRYFPNNSTTQRTLTCEERNKEYKNENICGILCNCCWVRNWAKEQLKKEMI